MYSGFIGNNYQNGSLSFLYTDEPNTTEEVIYKIKFTSTGSNQTMHINRVSPTEETEIYRETGVSTATAIEHPKTKTLVPATSITKQGQILETLSGVCDGRTVVVESGTYTMPNIESVIEIGYDHNNWTNLNNSFSYKPPTGTKQVIYTFKAHFSGKDSNGLNAFKLFLDIMIHHQFSRT